MTEGARPCWVVVGLGNPGHVHQHDRVNIGALAIDALAPLAPFARRGLSFVHAIELASTAVLLAKPQTYIERSGQAVADLLVVPWLEPSHMIVLSYDDSIPFGFLRVRSRGSHGGHPGLRPI